MPKGIAVGTLFIILPILFLYQGIFSSDEIISAPGTDLYTAFYFMRYYGFQSFLEGEIPLWNPYVFGGMPFVGVIQTAVFYPLNILFLLLPLNFAINCSIALHLFLSGIFLYLLLRHYKVERFGAILGGIVYTFSAPQIMHIYAGHLNMLTAMIWVPLLFLFCDKFFKETDFRNGWFLSLTIAIQFLAGQPQYLFYSMISLSCYFVYLSIIAYKDKTCSLRDIGKKGFFFTFFVFFGTTLTALQFLPTLEMIEYSTRQEITYEWASIFSLPPENLVTFLIPDFFGTMLETPYWGKNYLWEMSVYAGISPLFLVIICLCYVRNKITGFFLFLLFLSLILALGKYTPLFEFLYSYVPGFNLFRGSSKFVFISAFSLSLLAGFGANALATGVINQQKKFYRSGITATALLLLLLLLFMFNLFDAQWFEEAMNHSVSSGEFYGNADLVKQAAFIAQALDTFQQSSFWSACWVSATFLLLFLYFTGKVKGNTFKFILLLLILLDLFSFGMRYMTTFNSRSLMWDKEILHFLAKDKEPYRMIAPTVENVNSGVLSKIESLGGYDALMVKRYSEFINFSQNVNPDKIKLWVNISSISVLTNMMNAKYLLLPASAEFPGGNVVFNNSRHKLYEIPGALPRAFIVHEAKVLTNRDKIFQELASQEFNPLSYAIIEEELIEQIAPAIESELQEQVEFVRYSPNEIEMNVEMNSRGLLLLGNVFCPGWKAYVDGSEATIHAANYIMQSIEVPKGKHQVIFRYAPSSFRLGAIISLTALGLLVFFLIRSYRKCPPPLKSCTTK